MHQAYRLECEGKRRVQSVFASHQLFRLDKKWASQGSDYRILYPDKILVRGVMEHFMRYGAMILEYTLALNSGYYRP